MSVEYDGLRFIRPGHATVRIETDDLVLSIDPWADVIEGHPEDADVVLITHDDYDHYDLEGVRAVSTADTTVVAFSGIDTTDLDAPVVSTDVDETVTIGDVTARSIPAHNLAHGTHVRDSGEPFHAEGDGIGFLLDVQGTTVLVPGDTDFLPAHRDVSATVVLPPIGGTYTMDRHEAVELAEAVGADLVLPVHYDTFDAIETDAQAFVEDIRTRGMHAELF